jgi:hypothetical protein
MWQPNGSQALNQRAWVTGALYSESDFESTTTPIYAVALNWENIDNFAATSGNDQKSNSLSFDGIYKFRGFSANGMMAYTTRTPETGASFEQWGGFIQAGRLFSRRRFEVAGRYGLFDPTRLVARNDVREVRGAFNYYYARHGLKWQSDVGRVETQTGPTGRTVKLWEFRSQLQFIF